MFALERPPIYQRPRHPDSLPFGGWFLLDKSPTAYAVVAATGQTLTPESTMGDPIQLTGEWTDADVLGLVEAVRQTVPAQSLVLERTGSERARAEGLVKARNSWRRFTADYQQTGGK